MFCEIFKSVILFLFVHILNSRMNGGGNRMAYKHSKGWYISQLKEVGITKHPVELKKLKLYKTYIVRNLYFAIVNENIESK
jgi:hypothetical protein